MVFHSEKGQAIPSGAGDGAGDGRERLVSHETVRRAEAIAGLPQAVRDQAREESWSQEQLLNMARDKDMRFPPSCPGLPRFLEKWTRHALPTSWHRLPRWWHSLSPVGSRVRPARLSATLAAEAEVERGDAADRKSATADFTEGLLRSIVFLSDEQQIELVQDLAEVQHRRAVDALGLMLAHASITQDMHDAGQLFRSLFRRAAFDTMATSQLLRVSRAASDGASHLQIDAQKKIAAAVDALGGHGSPAGSCVWFVVGLEFSVRDWAARQGWAGKPVHGPIGQGILVAALGTLAGHFGLGAGQRAA